MFNVGFNRFGTTPPVVKNLIYLNIIMFVATWVFKASFQKDFYHIFGLHYFKSDLFSPMQIVTHMFMHGNLTHIFFNMFALWMFGKILESVWGSQRFFIYYIITGLGAAAIHTLVNFINYSHIESLVLEFSKNPTLDQYQFISNEYFSKILTSEALFYFNTRPFNGTDATEILQAGLSGLYNIPTVGASGAVFGILLAFGMLFPNTELMLLFPPIPIKAKWFVLGYGAIELFLGLQQPGSNIAHFAHLGGMLFGFIMVKYWNSKRSNFY